MTAPIPRKAPRQARAKATCDAIIEAAARILERDGPGGITTNRVAELAGVSIGSLYQYFPNKQAILAELVRGLRDEMLKDLEQAEQAIAGHGLADAVPVVIRASLAHHLRQPNRAQRIEEVEALLPLNKETAVLKARIAMLVTTILYDRGVPESKVAAMDLSAMVRGMADAAVSTGERDFEALAERITRAARGYLGITPADSGGRGGNG